MNDFFEGISCCEDKQQYDAFLNLKTFKRYDFENKDLLFRYHMFNKLRKISQMFKWEDLPDTIPNRIMELRVQTKGYMIYHYFEGNKDYDKGFYISFGTLGGRPNYNYMPTKAIVANPYLNFYKELVIDKDCVVIPNDRLYLGLLPICNYYSIQDVESDISMNLYKINTRMMALLSASDDDAYEDMKDIFNDLKNGKQKVILDSNFMSNGIKSQPLSNGNTSQTIIQLLEEKQYNKGSFWNEIGVQSNYNMKRETITSNENILNVDSILPLSDDMFEQRQEAIRKIEKIFGQRYKCDFSSSWKKLRKEIELKEKEINNNKEIKSNQLDNKSGGDNNENKTE